MLITAALSDGICRLHNGLKSEDTLLTAHALRQLGVQIEEQKDAFIVHGAAGNLEQCKGPIYLGNSGTSMRFITALTALGEGRYLLTGSKRMQERPIQDLLDGLDQLGIVARTANPHGCPPVEVEGGIIRRDKVTLNCEKSSQFLSALLLVAPYTKDGLDITVSRGPVSRPYIDMTLTVMEMFGVNVYRNGYRNFKIPGNQVYKSGIYRVEPDSSQAGYFWAAGAIGGVKITVEGIAKESRQGDLRFAQLLEMMGCRVSYHSNGISVQGGSLSAVDADMADMPDMVPTLAVVAAFARGTTHIENVAHLRLKESDRLNAVTTELSKMGIETSCTDRGLIVKGGDPTGAVINTYDDHRIAMSFAVAGLRVPGVFIENERCVDKSFPEFWEALKRL
jgi:3-phosphoshikimate 1-carboxyvinyltransferase